jgi:hypothetical protein
MKIINLILILLILFCNSCSKTEYEKKRNLENKIIGKTWLQLKKEKKLVPVGEGKSITLGSEFICLYFQYFKPLTIDEARELVVYAAETFYHNLNSDKKLNELTHKPYPMNWIQIEIFIYNPDYSKITSPGLSLVKFRREKLLFVTDDKDKFETIHEETYEEALKKLKDNNHYL